MKQKGRLIVIVIVVVVNVLPHEAALSEERYLISMCILTSTLPDFVDQHLGLTTWTATLVATGRVLTAFSAVMCASLTFVNICTTNPHTQTAEQYDAITCPVYKHSNLKNHNLTGMIQAAFIVHHSKQYNVCLTILRVHVMSLYSLNNW